MRPLLLTFAAAALLATSPVSAEESPPAEAGPRLDAPRSIESPPAPSTIRSPAMTIAGSIASGIGLGAIIAGAALWADAEGEAEAC